jgi:phosphatidylinositol alpha-1,6-mannosyltransferase
MAGHLLVTNDFPPKIGGIQSYLWELWRRLPPDRTTVLTTPYAGAAAFDAASPIRIVRAPATVLLPTRALAGTIRTLAAEVGADLVVLDPVLPLGLLGPRLGLPYAVVVHGAELAVPARLPGTRPQVAAVLRQARHVVAAGDYPAAEARRVAGTGLPRVTVVPPGVDPDRFVPIYDEDRRKARRSFGLPTDAPVVVSVSRLVPRKGMDVLIAAARRLAVARPDLTVAIAGSGRDRARLDALAVGAPVRLLGRVSEDRLPALYGCADVFAMCCRDRWGGLEQEGFGIVFLEAAACGVAQVAGDSGGAADAVTDGETGIVVRHPSRVGEVSDALARLLDDPARRERMGAASRTRAVRDFGYDDLAARLDVALRSTVRPAAP